MQSCYLCAAEVGGDGAAVCAVCVRKHVTPRRTSEIAVPAMPVDADMGSPTTVAGGCTWCGKDGGAVRKLLGNGTVSICNECVALCADVMDAELGTGWRG